MPGVGDCLDASRWVTNWWRRERCQYEAREASWAPTRTPTAVDQPTLLQTMGKAAGVARAALKPYATSLLSSAQVPPSTARLHIMGRDTIWI